MPDTAKITDVIKQAPAHVRASFFILLIAYILFLVMIASLSTIFFQVVNQSLSVKGIIDPPNQGEDIFAWALRYYPDPFFLVLSAIISGFLGYLLIRLGKSAVTDVIPENDRDLLTELLRKGEKESISLYVHLSSLRGFTGTFTHLGITGLPLATISLTILFSILAIFVPEEGSKLNTGFLDLAKLTLGAFIGSFVQRAVTTERNATSMLTQTRDRSHDDT